MSTDKNTYSLLIVHHGDEACAIADAFDQWVLEHGGAPGTRARIELPALLGFAGVVPYVEAVVSAQGVGESADDWLRTLPGSTKVIGVLNVDRGMTHAAPSLPSSVQAFQRSIISMHDLLGASDIERLQYVATHVLGGVASGYISHHERLRVLHASQQLQDVLPCESTSGTKPRF